MRTIRSRRTPRHSPRTSSSASRSSSLAARHGNSYELVRRRLDSSISSSTIRTGAGEDGEIDARGPWNQGEDLAFVDSPAFQALGSSGDEGGPAVDDRSTETAAAPR